MIAGVSEAHAPLTRCAESILDAEVKHVCVLAGVNSNLLFHPPTDTDGVAGCVVLCNTLLNIGKKVTVLTDNASQSIIRAGLQSYTTIDDEKNLSLISYAAASEWKDDNTEVDELHALFRTCDAVINVGRLGPSQSGGYYTHDTREASFVEPHFDWMFEWARQSKVDSAKPVVSVAIGRIGNELGMGNIMSNTLKYALNGDLIACAIPSDYPIFSTLIDWGAYALACAIYVVSNDANSAGKFPCASVDICFDALEAAVTAGARDGYDGCGKQAKVGSYEAEDYKIQLYNMRAQATKIINLITKQIIKNNSDIFNGANVYNKAWEKWDTD